MVGLPIRLGADVRIGQSVYWSIAMGGFRVWVGLGLLAVATTASGLTAEQLVAKNLEARGGRAAIEAIKTLKSEGSYVVGGGNIVLALTTYQKAPDKSRLEATLQGLTLVNAWDGRDAWQIMPFQGRLEPERMSAEDAKSLAESAPIGGLLISAEQLGGTLSYLGTEDIDGTEAHKLKLTLDNGDVAYIYLDPDHFLEIRTVWQRQLRGATVKSTTDFGDYEKVAGVYFPFSSHTEQGDGIMGTQQITIDSMQANVSLDDSMFTFPAAASEPAAAGSTEGTP